MNANGGDDVDDDVHEAEKKHDDAGRQLALDQRHFHVVEVILRVEHATRGRRTVAQIRREETCARRYQVEDIEADDTHGEEHRKHLQRQCKRSEFTVSATAC